MKMRSYGMFTCLFWFLFVLADNGRVIGTFCCPLGAVHKTAGGRGGGKMKINPHTLVTVKTPSLVIPVGIPRGRNHGKNIGEVLEGGALRFGDVGFKRGFIVDILGSGDDVEITHRQIRAGRRVAGEVIQKPQLVIIVRVIDGTPVGNVETPDAFPAAHCGNGAPLLLAFVIGLTGEGSLDILEPYTCLLYTSDAADE